MKLPKSFTTVTPLSKILALILLILLPILGFYFGLEYQKALSPLQGADPRTHIFATQEECESFTERMCLPTLCQSDPLHTSCQSNNQRGFYATRVEIGNMPEPTPATSSGGLINMETSCLELGGTFLEDYSECERISQEQCTDQFNGTFDECASACRHNPNYPDVACIDVCFPVCSL